MSKFLFLPGGEILGEHMPLILVWANVVRMVSSVPFWNFACIGQGLPGILIGSWEDLGTELAPSMCEQSAHLLIRKAIQMVPPLMADLFRAFFEEFLPETGIPGFLLLA